MTVSSSPKAPNCSLLRSSVRLSVHSEKTTPRLVPSSADVSSVRDRSTRRRQLSEERPPPQPRGLDAQRAQPAQPSIAVELACESGVHLALIGCSVFVFTFLLVVKYGDEREKKHCLLGSMQHS